VRGLVWFLVVAACAVGLALLAHVNEGYVLLVTPPWRTEVSLALFVIVLVSGFALAYSLLRVIVHTLRLPGYVAEFRARQRSSRAREALARAWRSYFEGRFGHAQQLAARSFDLGESPGIAALLAARAAHFMQDSERRDLWLTRASTAQDDDRNARLATQAELLLDDRRYEEARQVLLDLHAGGPRHVSTQRMLLRAEQGLRHWEEVIRLARQLEKRGAISRERARHATATAVIEMVRQKSADTGQLQQFWKTVDADFRVEPPIAAAAARAMIQLGDPRAANLVVRQALEHQWDEELVELWSRCDDAPGSDRLDLAERWLEDRPRDAALLLALGRLCFARELWGKAQSYLEASLSTQPGNAVHIELARLFDRLGRRDEANRHYRAAAS